MGMSMASVAEFQELSRQIDELFASGKKEEGGILLQTALQSAQGNDSYLLFFEGEQASYNGDYETALRKIQQAVSLNPSDSFLLKNCGVSLSKLGRMDEAIALFDQTLAVNPKDYDSLRQKGVSLSKLGREEEAIALYDQTLAVNPKDYDSLRNKGVSLFNLNQKKEAYEMLAQALKFAPDNKELQEIASFIFAQLSDKEEEEEEEKKTVPQSGESSPDLQNMGGLKGFILNIRKEFSDDIDEFERQKKENEQHLREFITGASRLDNEQSLFLVLRKWNSYTPALPLDNGEKSLGGGYFIFHKGCGTVIDLGYNFIDNFRGAGCRLEDIDNIILTHAHNEVMSPYH